MTANPVRPARYRPGKPIAEEPSSEEDEDDEPEEEQQQPERKPTAPPPKASSFPSNSANISGNLQKVNLNERRRQAAAEETARLEAEKAAQAAAKEGFVTEESEDEESGGIEGSDDTAEESGSEESSSDDDAPKKLLRPTFIRKDQRKENLTISQTLTEDQHWAEEEARRKQKADAMIQEQLERDAAARAAGKKDWDDDEIADIDEVDDTDGLDPEAERAEWKLRELKRVKRDREAIELAEKEREEVERRRNLSQEEREAEDRDFLDRQKAEREGRGSMAHMQKYVHKGAFFQDDPKADQRDLMGARVQDDTNKELLPEYMQIRDMTKLGRKGRTKYKDLRSEDTGRWGEFGRKGGRRDDAVDDIFKSDRDGGGPSASGSNTAPIGQRRPTGDQAPEGAPKGPRVDEARGGADSYIPTASDRGDHRRRRRDSYSRSPPPRQRGRRRSYSESRSPSPRRGQYQDERKSHKRSPSPYQDRHTSDKRRRVEAS